METHARRDFVGYGNSPPAIPWPNKAQLALSFVINLEEGAELSIADGDESNESVYEAIQEVRSAADPCMESHYEYGTRVGYWRLMETFAQAHAAVTVSACARSAIRSPHLARDAVLRGHELSCHGYRWESHAGLGIEQERSIIKKTHEALRSISGVAPKGWHTRSASSPMTRQLLVEHGGFLYDSDAYNDDCPYIQTVDGQEHVILPYAFDTNDMRFQPGGGFVQHNDFSDYCIAAFDELWEEGRHCTRMMSVGLHLRIMGKAARIEGLRTFLRYVRQKPAVWIARRDEIAKYWKTVAACTPTTPSQVGNQLYIESIKP